jgi:two-component system response regulator (stage 0 sporulation protein A)
MAIRLLVIDSDNTNNDAVKKYFSNSNNIEVVNVVNNKLEALEYIQNVDVVVVDLLLNGLDSMMILANIKEKCLNTKVIATSAFTTSEMMNNLNKYDVNYFIKKPYPLESLEKVVSSLFINELTYNQSDIKLQVTNLLHSLGIPSHIKGYNYIRDGIIKIYNDSSLIGAITKELYPTIANEYDTTSSRVERAIRHAIEVSWIRGDYHMMEDLFGNSIDYDRSKPTNAEFIVTLADRLKIDTKYA